MMTTRNVVLALLFSSVFGQTDVSDPSNENEVPSMAPSDGGFSFFDTDDPTASPSRDPESFDTEPAECFSTIAELDVLMIEMNKSGLDFKQKIFKMCPNTIFEVGFKRNNLGDCCLDGDVPFWPFSNTLIQCGDEGKSSDNCIVTSGQTQIFSNDRIVHENVEFRGMTFRDASLTVGFITEGGKYTFMDCIFEKHKPIAAVLIMTHSDECPDDNRRGLKELTGVSPEAREQLEGALDLGRRRRELMGSYGERRAQECENPVDGEIHLKNCTFRDNSPGPTTGAGFTQHTVLLAQGNDNIFTVEDTLFYDNDFDDWDPLPHAMIKMDKGKLAMKNSCFINNNVVGFGVVQLFQGAELLESTGNSGTVSTGTECAFLAKSDVEATSKSELECFGYESEVCTLEGAPEPRAPIEITQPPVVAPPPGPSSAALPHLGALVFGLVCALIL